MKVLIINYSDLNGGAAKASYRLHNALLGEQIDSKLFVVDKISNDNTVISNGKKGKFFIKLREKIDEFPQRLYKNRDSTYFSISWLGFDSLVSTINEINPDVVHFHWVNKGMLRLENLKKINLPIVFSLHDEWLYTGGCHYSGNCFKYENICKSCMVLNSNKIKDLSYFNFKRKENIFQDLNMSVVGLSNWIAKSAQKSSLLNGVNVVNLPNPIDTEIFRPIDKKYSRKIWNLPYTKKLILFGAVSALNDSRKGFKELNEVLKKIKNKKEYELVVFGGAKLKPQDLHGIRTNYLGNLKDETDLVKLYNAADILVVPSLQENLSNVIMEGLSCGLPVLAFDIGGNSDLIDHKQNGYLAKSKDSDDMFNGLEWILKVSNFATLKLKAREKVLYKFKNEIVAKQYIKLYQSVI